MCYLSKDVGGWRTKLFIISTRLTRPFLIFEGSKFYQAYYLVSRVNINMFIYDIDDQTTKYGLYPRALMLCVETQILKNIMIFSRFKSALEE